MITLFRPPGNVYTKHSAAFSGSCFTLVIQWICATIEGCGFVLAFALQHMFSSVDVAERLSSLGRAVKRPALLFRS